jgi:hypothetical protein
MQANFVIAVTVAKNASLSLMLKLTSNMRCMKYPDSPEFPNSTKWEELNQSIGGRLAKCPQLLSQNAWACSKGVAYAVASYSAHDVAAGMKFANDKNLRVSVRNTGHDFLTRCGLRIALVLGAYILNRNGGTGSLLIRMERMKGAQWIADWIPTATNTTSSQKGVKPQPAVVIHAGMTWEEVIPITLKNRHVVPSGGEKVGRGLPLLLFFALINLDSWSIRRVAIGRWPRITFKQIRNGLRQCTRV